MMESNTKTRIRDQETSKYSKILIGLLKLERGDSTRPTCLTNIETIIGLGLQ